MLKSLRGRLRLRAALVLAILAVGASAGDASAGPPEEVFSFSLSGRIRLDAATFLQEDAGPAATDFRRGSFNNSLENDRARDLKDGVTVRSARVMVDGAILRRLEYRAEYDLGDPGLDDGVRLSAAWLQYRLTPAWRGRVGAFAVPTGLEDAAGASGQLFLERPSSAEVARSVVAGNGRQAASLQGAGETWTLSLAATGDRIDGATTTGQRALLMRATRRIERPGDLVLHLGVSGAAIVSPGRSGTGGALLRLRDRPEVRVDGARLVDTGDIDVEGYRAVGLEAGLRRGAGMVEAEYFGMRMARTGGATDAEFSGWYIQGGWFLTGESRPYAAATGSFDRPRTVRAFAPRRGDWGALELALRYSRLDLDWGGRSAAPIHGGVQTVGSVGLNWHPDEAVLVRLAYSAVRADRRSPGGDAFAGPYPATPPKGAQVGQALQALSLMVQIAF